MKKRLIFSCLLSLATFPGISPGQPSAAKLPEIARARQLVQECNYDEAIQAVQHLLENPEYSSHAKVEIGKIKLRKAENELSKALSSFNDAATTLSQGLEEGGGDDAERPKLMYELASIYHDRMNNIPLAVSCYESIVKDYQNFIMIDKVTFKLASCLESLGRTDEAAAYFRDIVAKYSYSEFFKIAQAKLNKAAPGTSLAQDAIEAQEKTLEGAKNDSQAAKAAYELANLHSKQGNKKQALEEYKKISAEYPNSDEARRAMQKMADLLDKDKNYSEAASVLDDYVTKYPNDPDTEKNLLELGKIYEKNMQDYKTTTKEGRIVYRKSTENAQKALEYYEKVTETYPDQDSSAEAFLRKGEIYENSIKDPEQAKRQYQEFLKRFPDHAEAGRVSEKLKKLDE
ncbi:MAG: tetratricopeptide repeat protein [Candidatus Riflebacteria bacterium]|nr:tetratricopeptide repeat protein [Candidatus Riflebacteria bacterium]